jgi:putative hemolysin
MSAIATEIVIILLLLVGNGLFAMTEIAVVSARKARLRRLAETGDLKAQAALALAESPNRFLATVQVGITRNPRTRP